MTFRSYRKERMRELSDGMKERHDAAGKLIQKQVRRMTPIGTPESTGDPNYQITLALWKSIEYHPEVDSVKVGTNKYYGPYVHQGTYDYAHGYRGWTEAEAREFNSITDTGDGPGQGRKGMQARPFLVNGLLNARPFLYAIYNRPIN
jgi:hypothetical protein